MSNKKDDKKEVSVAGAFDLENVPVYLNQVSDRIAALEAEFGGAKDSDTPSSTDIPPFGDLSKVDDISQLVRANAGITTQAAQYEASAKDLGVSLKEHPFRVNGASAAKWSKYMKRRIGEATYKDELASLKAIQADLIDLSSEEDKKRAKLQSLESKLNKYAKK